MFRRHEQAEEISRANRAAAVGRLLLGQTDGWSDFSVADAAELATLPRRALRSGQRDVNDRLANEIELFYRRNFQSTTPNFAERLYDVIKRRIPHGFRLPRVEFEEEFARFKPAVVEGIPRHATASITLWGLQFEFPEDHFAKDIGVHVEAARIVSEELNARLKVVKGRPKARVELGPLLRRQNSVTRACLTASFSLMEAYLNGVAWDFRETSKTRYDKLSKRKRDCIDDNGGANFRSKLLKYPEIVAGEALWEKNEPEIERLLDYHKPFRDSLAHPSAFAAPEKFGGYDKLTRVYELRFHDVLECARITSGLISRISTHIAGEETELRWLEELKTTLEAGNHR